MLTILLVLLAVVVVAVVVPAVVSYFTSGAAKTKKELHASEERVSIAQTALIQIASGDASPVFRASDALTAMTNTYNKEI